jgi:plastocyanin
MKLPATATLLSLALLLAQSATFAKDAKVTISGFEYKPSTITIKKGDSVTFTNEDSAPHNVAPEKGAKFTASDRILKGKSATVIFKTTGDQSYFCEMHPSMKGMVKVTN